MNTNIIEQLLNESESAYLDFKREQYPFENANDVVKSELLKDILAFTNAWRRTDAYILIGVQEVKGGRSDVVGITKHLEDHVLQQFVNSKTQQPITLSYISMTYDGQQIGIIRIPVQARPVYLKKDYGKLKKNTVYIRRGSSTDEASPDEISKMGVADNQNLSNVDINIEFSDLQSRVLLGSSITLESKVLDFTIDKIPDFTNDKITGIPSIDFNVSRPNKRYYRELVRYYDERLLLRPVGVALQNLGQVTIHNTQLVISIERKPDLMLLTEGDFSERPKKYFNYLTPHANVDIPTSFNSNLSVETFGNKWVVTVDFENVQPKAVAWADEALFIGARHNETMILNAEIFADELPDPISRELIIEFKSESLKLGLVDLENKFKEEINRLLDEFDN